jgi:hypothetical protein
MGSGAMPTKQLRLGSIAHGLIPMIERRNYLQS